MNYCLVFFISFIWLCVNCEWVCPFLGFIYCAIRRLILSHTVVVFEPLCFCLACGASAVSSHFAPELAKLLFHLVWSLFSLFHHQQTLRGSTDVKGCQSSVVKKLLSRGTKMSVQPVMETVIGSGLSWDWFQWETLCGSLMKMCVIDVRAH